MLMSLLKVELNLQDLALLAAIQIRGFHPNFITRISVILEALFSHKNKLAPICLTFFKQYKLIQANTF